MEIQINKNLLPPVIIIFVALIIGSWVLLSDKKTPPQPNPPAQIQVQAGQQTAPLKTPVISANARRLELAVPGMFCAGCMASVEGYLSSVPGIGYVEARLTPRKSATVIYNPDKITKEEIVKNQVFDTYGPAIIISDEAFNSSDGQLKETQTTDIPITTQQKTNRVLRLLKENQDAKTNVQDIQLQLDKINQLLQAKQYQEAERLLDAIIKELENL